MIKRGLFLMMISLLVFGCQSSDTPAAQCTTDASCPSPKACMEGRCNAGVCTAIELADCCGNGKCEKDENSCLCKEDCTPACEGEVEFKGENNYKKKAKYFDYACINDVCQIKYDPGRIDPLQEYHTLTQNNIVIGVEVSYIQPFEISFGELELEIELKSFDDKQARVPINVTDIRILDQSQLVGRRSDETFSFTKIGQKHTMKVPVSYSMAFPEEEKSIQIGIDYNFMTLNKILVKDDKGAAVLDSNGQVTYKYIDNDLKITSGVVRLGKKITFIDPDYDKVKVDFSDE